MSKHPIPDRETRFLRLLYSHTESLIVAEFEREAGRQRVSSIYTRRPGIADYERLPAPDDNTSYCGPVVARAAPYVYFKVMRQHPTSGGGNWVNVARANLATREVAEMFTVDDLRGESARLGYPPWTLLHGWVSELLSVSDDGETLSCKIGLPESPRSDGGIRMNYSVVDLDVRRRSLRHLADLSSPHA